MSAKDAGGSAFPGDSSDGMTLRDYFAAAALQGMMATRRADTPRFNPDDDANYCYAVADSMLSERSKK